MTPERADTTAVVARYRQLVTTISYKPGWTFKVAGPLGRVLCVFATTPDSLNPTRQRTTQHQFPLPVGADLDDRTFCRWVFDQLLLAELHEAGEFFTVDGFRPFFPNHQDEGSPYDLVIRWET